VNSVFEEMHRLGVGYIADVSAINAKLKVETVRISENSAIQRTATRYHHPKILPALALNQNESLKSKIIITSRGP
jgi:hypothetical protein